MFMIGNPFVNGYSNTINDYSSVKIMQFTGLLDKNGKEIYEGDIDERGVEIVCGNVFKQVSIKSKGTIFHEVWQMEEKEIIGNIYENPDLLSTPNPEE